MPKEIVVNTGPIIALIAALSELDIFRNSYNKVIVPYEVSDEILAKGKERFDAKIFQKDNWIIKKKKPVKLDPFLENSLDKGEASVIQTALNENIKTVCIDEVAGRRIARLNNLKVTGSLGIIISAIKNGENFNIKKIISNMRKNGVWISEDLEKKAIKLVNES